MEIVKNLNSNLAQALHHSLQLPISQACSQGHFCSVRSLAFVKSAISISSLPKPSSYRKKSISTVGEFSFIRETIAPWCAGKDAWIETDLLTDYDDLVGLPLESSSESGLHQIFHDFGWGKRNRHLSSFRVQAHPFMLARVRRVTEQDDLQLRRTHIYCVPQSRGTPPKRDTGIASEKEWGIDLNNEKTYESLINEDGSTVYRESGEDLGDNGYRCRWTVMGGHSVDGSSEWKETWWEKSDWTGYKELGAKKSGRNTQGDSWWETWQEVLRQDEWSNLAWIEKSAEKQAKSGNNKARWYEKWWEKYNAKGGAEKGAQKYGRLNDQSWWEKWGEEYDGQGAVLKWTDKWAETDMGTKWGDKWEDRFFNGVGTRQGETWHVSGNGERWSRTWGEEHFGNGKVHKYGKSTSGESWDTVVKEGTYYEAEPHYGWADAIGNSGQLLAIEARERPPGVYPDFEIDLTATQLPSPGNSAASGPGPGPGPPPAAPPPPPPLSPT
eukprot:c20656_g1_i1 orf=908-2395(+)